MKFKVLANTGTYNAFIKLRADIEAADRAADKFCKELGGIDFFRAQSSIGGGISGIDFGPNENGTDKRKRGWFKIEPKEHNYRFPKDIPENSELLSRINELPAIFPGAFNSIMKTESYDKDPYAYTLSKVFFAPGMILIDFPERLEREDTSDLIEILTTEFNQLSLAGNSEIRRHSFEHSQPLTGKEASHERR